VVTNARSGFRQGADQSETESNSVSVETEPSLAPEERVTVFDACYRPHQSIVTASWQPAGGAYQGLRWRNQSGSAGVLVQNRINGETSFPKSKSDVK
jgi:hypothetical protein